MNKKSGQINLVVAGVLIGAAFVVGILYTQLQSAQKQLKQAGQPQPTVADTAGKKETGEAAGSVSVDPVDENDHIRGDKNAPFALIEYSDLECPYCQRFHPTALQAVNEYAGKLIWVYRHFPLIQIHSKAPKEAEATECAAELGGEEAFWALTDKIYEVTPGNNGLDLGILPDLALQVGLNRSEFVACLDSGKMRPRVDADYQSGVKAGVTGTPGNILLNRSSGETLFIPGAVPFEKLKSTIDDFIGQN